MSRSRGLWSLVRRVFLSWLVSPDVDERPYTDDNDRDPPCREEQEAEVNREVEYP